MPPLPPLPSAPSRCRCRCRCPRRPRLLPDRAGRARGTARGRDRPRSASAGSARHRRRPVPAPAALDTQCPAGSRGVRPETLSHGGTPSTVAFAQDGPRRQPVGAGEVKSWRGRCDRGPAFPGTHCSLLPQVQGAGVGLGAASLWLPPAEMWEDRAGALQTVTSRLMAMPG